MVEWTSSNKTVPSAPPEPTPCLANFMAAPLGELLLAYPEDDPWGGTFA